jgi:hypothetical protein
MTRTSLLLAVLSLAGIVLTLASSTCSGNGYYCDSDYWPYPKSPYLQQSAWYNEINFFLNDYGEAYYPTTYSTTEQNRDSLPAIFSSSAYSTREQYSGSLPAIFSSSAYANSSGPIFLTPYYPSIANSRN